MSGRVNIEGRCLSLNGEDRQETCRYLARSCADQANRIDEGLKSPGTFELESPDGNPFKNIPDLDSCLNMSVRIPKMLGPLPNHIRGSSGQTSQPPAPPRTQAPPQTAQRAMNNPPTLPESEYAGCSHAGPAGSMKNDHCRRLIDICASSSPPYQFPFRGSSLIFNDRDQCFSAAPRVARLETFGGEPQQAIPPPPAQDASGAPSFFANGSTSFAKSFYEARFEPVVSVKSTIEDIDLPFTYEGGLKGVNATIVYSIEPSGGHIYRMRYEIFDRGGKSLGGQREISFGASEGKINDDLAFGITLAGPGDFGRIESIQIVKLE